MSNFYVDVYFYHRPFGHDETERVGVNLTKRTAFAVAADILRNGLVVNGKRLHVTGVEVYKCGHRPSDHYPKGSKR
jgi:hypothetical protein